jgi:hypothetical protein
MHLVLKRLSFLHKVQRMVEVKSNKVMYIIPTLRRLRQEDCKLRTSLGYTVRHCLQKNKTKKQMKKEKQE